jgi:hypothetical protein
MIVCLFLDTDERRDFSEEARRAVRDVCDAAEPTIRGLLPVLPSEIELAVQTGGFVIPETGELGVAVAERRVSWTVSPARPGGVAETVRAHLRHTLFHELHHIARGWVMMGRNEHRAQFIDGVVCEGLATAFERDFGGFRPPWGEYPADVVQWVRELSMLPRTASYRHWMFQHPDGRRWVGYRAGTYIVDRVKAATGRSAADLVRTPAREILRIAGVELPN